MADPRERDDDLDPRLRAALEPREGQAERVAREALEPRPGAVDRLLRRVFEWRLSFARRHPLRSLFGLSLAIALGGWLVAFAVLAVLELRTAGQPPRAETGAARYSLTNRDGVLVVRRPDGGAAFLHSRERPAEPPRGMMLIVRGDHRP
jgi:hypothetical protein